jgi:hypothetical protein
VVVNSVEVRKTKIMVINVHGPVPIVKAYILFRRLNMSVAAIWGTTVGYTEYGDSITIETIDRRVAVIRKQTFNYLYCRLDDFTAALKEDCIEYVTYHPDKPISFYPDWFREAMDDGWITNDYGTFIFLEDSGELAMSPNDIILRNFMGDLMYVEESKFHKYYDTLEG